MYVMQCQMELARRIRDHTRLFIHSFFAAHLLFRTPFFGFLTAGFPRLYEEAPTYKGTLQGCTKRTRYRDAFRSCQSDSHRWQACTTRRIYEDEQTIRNDISGLLRLQAPPSTTLTSPFRWTRPRS